MYTVVLRELIFRRRKLNYERTHSETRRCAKSTYVQNVKYVQCFRAGCKSRLIYCLKGLLTRDDKAHRRVWTFATTVAENKFAQTQNQPDSVARSAPEHFSITLHVLPSNNIFAISKTYIVRSKKLLRSQTQ